MWCLYRFTRSPESNRGLDANVRSFAQTIVEQAANRAIWVEATARVGGGIDVWFNLPVLPTDPTLAPAWQDQLRQHDLVAQRITSRA